MPGLPRLTVHQRSLLKERLPGMSVVADLSWGLTDGVVLHVRATGRDLVVKAGSPQDHHIGREIEVHRAWVGCLATQGRAPRLLWADESAHLLVTGYVEGELVLGAEAERHLETYAQAGALVARFHGQAARTDADYERGPTHGRSGGLTGHTRSLRMSRRSCAR